MDEKRSFKKRIFHFIMMTLGAMLYGLAISMFLDPNNLAPGGVSGIAIILNRLIPVETGTIFFVLNIPIMILGFWKFGGKFIVSTLYCIFVTSVSTNIFTEITGKLATNEIIASNGAVTDDPLLASIAGGALVAIALSVVFKAGATTGGTDVIVKCLRIRFPHMKTGALLLVLDCIIITASAFVFKDIDRALYAGISVTVTSFVIDLMLYGKDGAKLLYIISDKSEEITNRILQELDIGVTHIVGYGAYSGKEKKVIMCVIKKPIYHKAEAIVKEEDPQAFLIVSSASEIFGEGYKSYFSEKL